MAILENSQKWTFTSTGSGDAFNSRGYAQGLTFYIETSSGCTATVQIQSRAGDTTGINAVPAWGVLSTVNSTLGELNVAQFMGPLEWVRPRVTDKTAGSTASVVVYLLGN
jgi:hypothetical protein